MSNIPRMCTIKETAKTTGLAEHYIRQLCISGNIVALKAGNKYLINLDRFIDYLNGDKIQWPTAPATYGQLRKQG